MAAHDVSATITEDQATTTLTPSVLTVESDDTAGTYALNSTAGVHHSSVVYYTDGTFTYSVDQSYVETLSAGSTFVESFTYTAKDNHLDAGTGTALDRKSVV